MAIDPPYRLDPFRNIINVHWEAGLGGLKIAYFIFSRAQKGVPAPFLPVTEQFVKDVITDRETSETLWYAIDDVCGNWNLRSRMLAAAAACSEEYTDMAPNPFGWFPTFRQVFDVQDTLFFGGSPIQPSESNPWYGEGPARYHRVYHIVTAYYHDDDITYEPDYFERLPPEPPP